MLELASESLDLGRVFVLAATCVFGLAIGVLERGFELVRAVAVLGGFGGGDLDERVEVGGACGRVLGLLFELGAELVGGRARVGGFCACGGEVGLELGDAFVRCGLSVGSCCVKLGCELVGVFAVVGGFGGGDVDERLEVGGACRRVFGLVLELGACSWSALARASVAVCACGGEVGLELGDAFVRCGLSVGSCASARLSCFGGSRSRWRAAMLVVRSSSRSAVRSVRRRRPRGRW